MKRFIMLAVSVLILFTASVRSNADPIVFVGLLQGVNEAPPNGSLGTGFATVTIDPVAHTMRVEVTFQNLTAGNTAAHIHAPTTTPFTGTAGVATTVPTFTGFPTGAVSGTYDHTFDTLASTSYNPAFIAANGGTTGSAEAAFFQAIMQGRSYLNIHTSNFQNGEIRGFLQPVPESATMLLLGSGLVGLALKLRRRRKSGVSTIRRHNTGRTGKYPTFH